MLAKILTGDETLGHGRNGYYLASSGSVAWEDMYSSIAAALVRRGVIASAEVPLADDEALERMARGLGGISKEMVRVQLGGKYVSRRKRGLCLPHNMRPSNVLIAGGLDVRSRRSMASGLVGTRSMHQGTSSRRLIAKSSVF